MRVMMVYKCECCGKQSSDPKEILKHEAAHFRLTEKQYTEWQELRRKVVMEVKMYGLKQNDLTEGVLNRGLKQLTKFEAKHGLTFIEMAEALPEIPIAPVWPCNRQAFDY